MILSRSFYKRDQNLSQNDSCRSVEGRVLARTPET